MSVEYAAKWAELKVLEKTKYGFLDWGLSRIVDTEYDIVGLIIFFRDEPNRRKRKDLPKNFS